MFVHRLRTRRRPIGVKGHIRAVMLQIGSNDQTDHRCSVEQFVVDYWAYIQCLHRRYVLQRVVVMEILQRKDPLRYRMNMTVAEYNQKVDNTNAELKLMCARSINNVLFWRHISHVRLPGAISRDAVNALKHYYRSVKGAVMHAARG